MSRPFLDGPGRDRTCDLGINRCLLQGRLGSVVLEPFGFDCLDGLNVSVVLGGLGCPQVAHPLPRPSELRTKRYGAPTWSFLLSLDRFHGHTPSISTSSEKLSRIRIRTMIPSTVTLSNV